MVVSRRALCVFYATVAALALVATWHQNLAYLGGDPLAGTVRFWRETLVTPASVSITVDLFLFGLAVSAWMVVEARRLDIPFVALYLVLGAVVAISVSVPLFLLARERRLRTIAPAGDGVTLTTSDAIVLGVLGLPALVLSLWSLGR